MKKVKKAKKKTAMQKRRERYFGIVKLPVGVKMAWLSKEDKNGFSLGLALNSRTVWLKGLRFRTKKEISRVVDRMSIVCVELKKVTE